MNKISSVHIDLYFHFFFLSLIKAWIMILRNSDLIIAYNAYSTFFKCFSSSDHMETDPDPEVIYMLDDIFEK